MDFHLDRQLGINVSPQHGNLYRWAVVETDDAGNVIGHDAIPWGWTLYFAATEISVSDSVSIATKDLSGRESDGEVEARTVIRAKLRPGDPRTDRYTGRDVPTYRMFGTDRIIEDFRLDITPTGAERDSCSAWGAVSYTSEVDFRNETTLDLVNFYLSVSQERFDRYLWNIAQNLADEVILAVGFVDGFYSGWSPSISTDEIKVLTTGEEHAIAVPGSLDVVPPRLGNVGKADFFMNAHRTLRASGTASSPDAEVDEDAVRRPGFRWPRRR